jgi:hypothetical protein
VRRSLLLETCTGHLALRVLRSHVSVCVRKRPPVTCPSPLTIAAECRAICLKCMSHSETQNCRLQFHKQIDPSGNAIDAHWERIWFESRAGFDACCSPRRIRTYTTLASLHVPSLGRAICNDHEIVICFVTHR